MLEIEKDHTYIYLDGDIRPFSKFNFEIALDELLCYDEINLITMRDKSNNIDIKNRNKCSWNKYYKLRDDFEDWLFNDKVEIKGEWINNLDSIIYFYNQESGGTKNSNPLLEYIKQKCMKIDNKFYKYFFEENKSKYKDCF